MSGHIAVPLTLLMAAACTEADSPRPKSSLLGGWSLSSVDGLAPKGAIFLEGTSRGLRLSGCGEMFATARGSAKFSIGDVAETTQCSDDVAEALRRLHSLMHSEATAVLTDRGTTLTLVGENGQRAEFIELMPTE